MGEAVKEELTQVTVEALKGMLSNLAQAKGFVLEQAPDVLQGMVTVGRIQSCLFFSIATLMLLLGALTLFMGVKKDEEGYFVMAFLLVIASLFIYALNAHEFITAWFAPKVYLLEHIASMLKG
jgi:hypothetical protein